MPEPRSRSRSLRLAILWIARICGSLIVAIFAAVVISELAGPGRSSPTPQEWFQLSLFPIGLCVGYVVAWRWQLVGGIISLGCLALFFVVMSASGSPVHGTPAFYPFGAPGLLFIWYGLPYRRRARAGGST